MSNDISQNSSLTDQDILQVLIKYNMLMEGEGEMLSSLMHWTMKTEMICVWGMVLMKQRIIQAHLDSDIEL